jgi:hypothetical protein
MKTKWITWFERNTDKLNLMIVEYHQERALRLAFYAGWKAAEQPLEADRALPASQQAENSNGPAA